MQYRDIKKANVKVSALGLGCMRLPQSDGRIDRPDALRMMHTAVERGINYFDSAYMYHDGDSEPFVGEAIKEIGRDKMLIATKMPCSMVEKKEDLERILDDQLKKLGVDTIDFYLFHNLNVKNWTLMQRFDALTFMDKAVEKGKVRFPGFSHHDNVENFTEIIDAYPRWTIAQTILNYLDDHYQAGLEGVRYAMQKDINTVVMEPLKGGMLTASAPESVVALFKDANPDVSIAEWAMRWVYSIPEVSCILSGMSTMQQLEENLNSFDRFEHLSSIELSDSEKALFAEAKRVFLEHSGISCSSCRYCMPCPGGVEIPLVFGHYNIIKMFGNHSQAQFRYPRMMDTKTSADNCIECGRCEGLCPQHLPIMELLKEAHAAMKP